MPHPSVVLEFVRSLGYSASDIEAYEQATSSHEFWKSRMLRLIELCGLNCSEFWLSVYKFGGVGEYYQDMMSYKGAIHIPIDQFESFTSDEECWCGKCSTSDIETGEYYR